MARKDLPCTVAGLVKTAGNEAWHAGTIQVQLFFSLFVDYCMIR